MPIAYSVSPDGSSIAFGTNQEEFGDREIWLMEPSGERARKLYEADANSAIIGSRGSAMDNESPTAESTSPALAS